MPEVAVVGSINVDTSITVPHTPRRGETMLGSDTRRSGGGKGANQAVGCARMGRSVVMVGAVGDDPDGEFMLGLLEQEGVETTNVRRLAAPTGQAIILVEPDGESTIVVAPGANAAFSVGDLDACASVISSAACVLVQQEIGEAVVARAAELAGGLFVLNPAPARPIALSVLKRVDVLVPNRHELATLCGADPTEDMDALAEMALALQGPQAVVVTLGPAGALVVEHGQSVHVAPLVVDAVDATAAGDTFCATLVHGILAGYSLVAAARLAAFAAAMAVERPGAMDSIPTAEELRNRT